MRTFDYLKYAMVMFCCVLGMSLTSCDDDDDDKKTGSLKVSTNKIEMAPGAKSNVTVRGGTAPYTASVRNTNIATASVSNTTVTVTGVNAGSTTLTISDKNRKNALVSITVKGAATGLTVDKSTVNVAVGKEETVNISGGTTPYTATSSSTATATAAVSGQKVTIKGVKAGTATITVTDKNKKTASIKVTVK